MMLLCLDADEIINIIGIVVNAALGIWIAVNVQTGFAEKRFLKDFILKDMLFSLLLIAFALIFPS